MQDHDKLILDWTSLAVTIGTIVNWLPSVACLLSIIWTGIRIYEYFKGKYNESED